MRKDEVAEMEKLNPINSHLSSNNEEQHRSEDSVEKSKKNLEEQDVTKSILYQTKGQKAILYLNLVTILIGAAGFYVYFSINPFTRDQIRILQDEALKNMSISLNLPSSP